MPLSDLSLPFSLNTPEDDAAVSLTDEASEALEDGEAPNESDR